MRIIFFVQTEEPGRSRVKTLERRNVTISAEFMNELSVGDLRQNFIIKVTNPSPVFQLDRIWSQLSSWTFLFVSSLSHEWLEVRMTTDKVVWIDLDDCKHQSGDL
jgi:hypothetical protein